MFEKIPKIRRIINDPKNEKHKKFIEAAVDIQRPLVEGITRGFKGPIKDEFNDWKGKYPVAPQNSQQEIARRFLYARRFFKFPMKPPSEIIGFGVNISRNFMPNDGGFWWSTSTGPDLKCLFRYIMADIFVNAQILKKKLEVASLFDQMLFGFPNPATPERLRLHYRIDPDSVNVKDTRFMYNHLGATKRRSVKIKYADKEMQNRIDEPVLGGVRILSFGFSPNLQIEP